MTKLVLTINPAPPGLGAAWTATKNRTNAKTYKINEYTLIKI